MSQVLEKMKEFTVSHSLYVTNKIIFFNFVHILFNCLSVHDVVLFLGESQESKGLFQFMKKTKTVRHKPEGEGIYLDDLNLKEMDPEVAKLYFPKR